MSKLIEIDNNLNTKKQEPPYTYIVIGYDDVSGTIKHIIDGGYNIITMYDKNEGVTRKLSTSIFKYILDLCSDPNSNYIISIPLDMPDDVSKIFVNISKFLEIRLEFFTIGGLRLHSDEYVHVIFDCGTHSQTGYEVAYVYNRETYTKITGKGKYEIIKNLMSMYRYLSLTKRIQFIISFINWNTQSVLDDFCEICEQTFDSELSTPMYNSLSMIYFIKKDPEIIMNITDGGKC